MSQALAPATEKTTDKAASLASASFLYNKGSEFLYLVKQEFTEKHAFANYFK